MQHWIKLNCVNPIRVKYLLPKEAINDKLYMIRLNKWTYDYWSVSFLAASGHRWRCPGGNFRNENKPGDSGTQERLQGRFDLMHSDSVTTNTIYSWNHSSHAFFRYCLANTCCLCAWMFSQNITQIWRMSSGMKPAGTSPQPCWPCSKLTKMRMVKWTLIWPERMQRYKKNAHLFLF